MPHDTPAANWLPRASRWNPLLDAVSSYVNGAELSAISVHDIDSYVDTDLNWKVREGYGALIAAYGARCNVVLQTEVSLIDHAARRSGLRPLVNRARQARDLHSSNGAHGRTGGALPPAASVQDHSFGGAAAWNAEKVLLAMDEPEMLPADGHLFGATNRTATGSYDLRPLGQPCIEAFFGGKLARELELSGELASFAIEELVAVLGTGFRNKVRPRAASFLGAG